LAINVRVTMDAQHAAILDRLVAHTGTYRSDVVRKLIANAGVWAAPDLAPMEGARIPVEATREPETAPR
jgi:hypothetical protein